MFDCLILVLTCLPQISAATFLELTALAVPSPTLMMVPTPSFDETIKLARTPNALVILTQLA